MNGFSRRATVLVLPMAMLLALAGCSGAKLHALHGWTAEVKSRPGPKIPPIPEMLPYEAYTFPKTNLRSPFVPVSAPKVSGVHPNLHRKKQYLERFPLDALKFVGEIAFADASYALIQDPQGIVHRVRAGSYIGQNNGRITAILADEIRITEIVPNGTGGYRRRPASLSLAQQPGG